MKRRLLTLFSALALTVITYFVLLHLYSNGHLSIDVSDGDGHGPDYDTVEWQRAVRSVISFRAGLGSVLVGIAALGLGSWWWKPSRIDL
jgi:hypothetical protein